MPVVSPIFIWLVSDVAAAPVESVPLSAGFAHATAASTAAIPTAFLMTSDPSVG
jgi:hypothetical protein